MNNPIFWYLILSNHNQGYNQNYNNGGFASSSSNQNDWSNLSETKPVESGTSWSDILSITAIVLLVVVVIYGIYVAVFKKI